MSARRRINPGLAALAGVVACMLTGVAEAQPLVSDVQTAVQRGLTARAAALESARDARAAGWEADKARSDAMDAETAAEKQMWCTGTDCATPPRYDQVLFTGVTPGGVQASIDYRGSVVGTPLPGGFLYCGVETFRVNGADLDESFGGCMIGPTVETSQRTMGVWVTKTGVYRGSFLNNLPSGMGVLELKNGSEYEGGLTNGRPNVSGVFLGGLSSKVLEEAGNWEFGAVTGYGVATSASDGSIMVGQFVKGVLTTGAVFSKQGELVRQMPPGGGPPAASPATPAAPAATKPAPPSGLQQ